MGPKFMPCRLALISTMLTLSFGAAHAVSVTNRDARSHTLTVFEGDAKTDHVLAPAASLGGICMKGCLMRLNASDKDEYELEGPEVVSVEDGYLYSDGPEPSPGAASPGAAPPGAPADGSAPRPKPAPAAPPPGPVSPY